METAKISSQGQITIPKSFRKLLNVKGGDDVAFIDYGTHVGILRKTGGLDGLSSVGAKHSKVKLTIAQMDEALFNSEWEAKN